jgi:precorrin-4/cobalt-precorrin-4 C11-methyltransferase
MVECGKVYFLGAGPGDPELLTIKAWRILERADLVIYADSLVHPGVAALARPEAEVIGSAGLALGEIMERMIAAARRGQTVARVQSGDPTLYGAIHEQMVRLDQAGVPYEIVPGVSSAFAAAAALGCELTVPDVAQTVIFTRLPSRTTTVPERERLRELARLGGTLAIFLSIHVIDRVVAELLAGGLEPATPAAVVYRVTWADEQVLRGTLADIAGQVHARHLTRQALILVGPAVGQGIRELAALRRSHLYCEEYSHGFRVSRPGAAASAAPRDGVARLDADS